MLQVAVTADVGRSGEHPASRDRPRRRPAHAKPPAAGASGVRGPAALSAPPTECAACGAALPPRPTGEVPPVPGLPGTESRPCARPSPATIWCASWAAARWAWSIWPCAAPTAGRWPSRPSSPPPAAPTCRCSASCARPTSCASWSIPHIVAFRDMGESDGMLFFAMDYVRGQDAHQLAQEAGAVRRRPGRAALICQLLDALAFAHGRGFVHRDVKPSNLLITEEDGARTADGGRLRPGQGLPGVQPERPDDDRRRGRHDPVHGAGADHGVSRGQAAGGPVLGGGVAVQPADGGLRLRLPAGVPEPAADHPQRRRRCRSASGGRTCRRRWRPSSTAAWRGSRRQRFPEAAAMREALRKFAG